MTKRSRRRVLAGCVALLAGTSGCASGDTDDTPTATATEHSFAHTDGDPTARTVRNPEGKPAVRSSAARRTDEWVPAEWSVTTPEERDALEFAATATGVAEATQFVDDADLSAGTVLVHQYSVDACRTRRLDRIQWRTVTGDGPERTEVRARYAEIEREGACRSSGPADVEATLVFVPAEVELLGGFASLVT